MSKQSGVWLDKRIANIIHIDEDNVTTIKVGSQISEGHIGGGSRSKQPYGPMDVTSESKLLNKKKSQMNDYFKNILEAVSSRDELYVFGPAETKTAFTNYINNRSDVTVIISGVESADSMTMNQKKAKVIDFFK